jgi:transcriptional regulator with XRE-family HTH domain
VAIVATKKRGAVVIGKRVKAARLRKGFTQQVVADAAGVTAGAIRAIEGGYSEPRTSTLQRLCEILRTPADHILFGIGPSTTA